MKIIISNRKTYFAQTKSADKPRLDKNKVYQRLDDDSANSHYSIRRKHHSNKNIKLDVAYHFAPQAVLAIKQNCTYKTKLSEHQTACVPGLLRLASLDRVLPSLGRSQRRSSFASDEISPEK